MTTSPARPAPYRENPLPNGASGPAAVDATLEFGRFRVLLRRRQLVADGVEIELGTRGFDLLLALAEADGSLVTKEELMNRVWPGIVVRKRTSRSRSPRCAKLLAKTANLSGPSSAAATGSLPPFAPSSPRMLVSTRRNESARAIKGLFPQCIARRPSRTVGASRGHSGRRFDLFPPRAPSARARGASPRKRECDEN